MTLPLADRLRLILVTDPSVPEGRTMLDTVRAALRAGVPTVQLRTKAETAREAVELARVLREETRDAGALFFVNDRVDVALAAGADGAHLGQDDLPVAAARRIVPTGFLLGASAETAELARQAEADGADYVGVGPVYPTGSKADAGEPVGTERLREVAAAVRIPVVGIGGINAGNAASALATGGAGIAVISAIMRAADPARATRELLRRYPPPTARPALK